MVIAMVTHKVYTGKVELAVALCAPRHVGHSRVLRVLEIFDLFQLRRAVLDISTIVKANVLWNEGVLIHPPSTA